MRGEFIDIGGRRLYYYAAGSRASGETLVFLHGALTSSHLWSELIPLLDKRHRVVVVDLAGHGRSDPAARDELTRAGHAQAIAGLFRTLGIGSASVVGHEFGAGVALELAFLLPGRVARLGLLSPRTTGVSALALRALARLYPFAARVGGLTSIVKGSLRTGYADESRGNRSLDIYLRPFESARGRAALMAQLSACGMGEPVVFRGDATVRAPVGVFWGESDPLVSYSEVERLHSEIPGSTLHVVETGRHFLPEESPVQVAALIEELLTRPLPPTEEESRVT